mgnify:CR=1 FL=1
MSKELSTSTVDKVINMINMVSFVFMGKSLKFIIIYLTTWFASSSSFELMVSWLCVALPRFMSNRITLPKVTKPIVPPCTAKFGILLTVRVGDSPNSVMMSLRNFSSDVPMNRTVHWSLGLNVEIVFTCSERPCIGLCSSSLNLSLPGSSPRRHKRNSVSSVSSVGHEMNLMKLYKYAAFRSCIDLAEQTALRARMDKPNNI